MALHEHHTGLRRRNVAHRDRVLEDEDVPPAYSDLAAQPPSFSLVSNEAPPKKSVCTASPSAPTTQSENNPEPHWIYSPAFELKLADAARHCSRVLHEVPAQNPELKLVGAVPHLKSLGRDIMGREKAGLVERYVAVIDASEHAAATAVDSGDDQLAYAHHLMRDHYTSSLILTVDMCADAMAPPLHGRADAINAAIHAGKLRQSNGASQPSAIAIEARKMTMEAVNSNYYKYKLSTPPDFDLGPISQGVSVVFRETSRLRDEVHREKPWVMRKAATAAALSEHATAAHMSGNATLARLLQSISGVYSDVRPGRP